MVSVTATLVKTVGVVEREEVDIAVIAFLLIKAKIVKVKMFATVTFVLGIQHVSLNLTELILTHVNASHFVLVHTVRK